MCHGDIGGGVGMRITYFYIFGISLVHSASNKIEALFVLLCTLLKFASRGSRVTIRCKIFIWLAILNCCWTANGLACHELNHPEYCPLCDQADETIQHFLTS
uniref:Reverse transcriptase zinc-binding domain-containing protein n=1 Tax=Setaria italica TaxID=4555 RepID=K3YMQ3_SETIT